MRTARRLCSERGQSTAEYAGVIFVVVAIVIVLIGCATPIGKDLACKVQEGLSGIGGGGAVSCSAGSKVNPYDVAPADIPVASQEKKNSTSAGLDIKAGPGNVTVKGEDGTSLEVVLYGDGSEDRQLVSQQEAAVGYEIGTGKGTSKGGKDDGSQKKPAGGFSAKINGSASVSGTRTTTNTYNCGGSGETSCEEWDKTNADAVNDHLSKHGVHRIRNRNREINGGPDKTVDSLALKVKLEGSGSVDMNLDHDPSADPEAEKGRKEKTGDYDAHAGMGFKVTGEVSYTSTTTTQRGEKGDKVTSSEKLTYKGEYGGNASVSAQFASDSFGLEAGGSNSYLGSYETTRDADGNLISITFTAVQEGTGKASIDAKVGEDRNGNGKDGAEGTVTSTIKTTLDVSALTPEQRKIANDYVNSSLTNGALTVPQSALNPAQSSTNEFDNILYERAQVTRSKENGLKITEEGGIDLVVFSYKESSTTTSKNTVSYEVLGKPGSDGKRTYTSKQVP